MPADANQRYLLIGTGTGVTPVPRDAAADRSADRASAASRWCCCSARARRTSCCTATTSAPSPTSTRTSASCRASRASCRRRFAHAHADVRHGYVQQFLAEFAPNAETDIAYLCGNPNMVDACFEALKGSACRCRRSVARSTSAASRRRGSRSRPRRRVASGVRRARTRIGHVFPVASVCHPEGATPLDQRDPCARSDYCPRRWRQRCCWQAAAPRPRPPPSRAAPAATPPVRHDRVRAVLAAQRRRRRRRSRRSARRSTCPRTRARRTAARSASNIAWLPADEGRRAPATRCSSSPAAPARRRPKLRRDRRRGPARGAQAARRDPRRPARHRQVQSADLPRRRPARSCPATTSTPPIAAALAGYARAVRAVAGEPRRPALLHHHRGDAGPGGGARGARRADTSTWSACRTARAWRSSTRRATRSARARSCWTAWRRTTLVRRQRVRAHLRERAGAAVRAVPEAARPASSATPATCARSCATLMAKLAGRAGRGRVPRPDHRREQARHAHRRHRHRPGAHVLVRAAVGRAAAAGDRRGRPGPLRTADVAGADDDEVDRRADEPRHAVVGDLHRGRRPQRDDASRRRHRARRRRHARCSSPRARRGRPARARRISTRRFKSTVPALLLSGELDPVTPPRYGERGA